MSKGKKSSLALSAPLALAATWFGNHCGSGFSTGRTVVQWGSFFGFPGLFYPLVTWAIELVYIYIAVEFCRLVRTRNYKDFALSFYAPHNKTVGMIAIIVWDVLSIMSSTVSSSSILAGAGTLFEQIFGFNYYLSCAVFCLVIAIILIYGKSILDSMGGLSIPLVIIVVVICVFGLAARPDLVSKLFTERRVGEGYTLAKMLDNSFSYAAVQSGFLTVAAAFAYTLTDNKSVKKFAMWGILLNCGAHFLLNLLMVVYSPATDNIPLPVVYVTSQFTGTLGVILYWLYQATIFLALITTVGANVYSLAIRWNPVLKRVIKIQDDKKLNAVIFMMFLAVAFLLSMFGFMTVLKKGWTLVSSLRKPLVMLPIMIYGPFRIHQERQKIREGKPTSGEELGFYKLEDLESPPVAK